MIGCDCFRRNGVMQSMGKERSEGHMILTIIILVLFHVGRKNASASFHRKKKKKRTPEDSMKHTERRKASLYSETCSSVKESAWRNQSVKNIQQVRLICQPGKWGERDTMITDG